MGALVYRALCETAARLMFWCVGVPVAALWAAWLAGIAAMCLKELWSIRKHGRKREKRPDSAEPPR